MATAFFFLMTFTSIPALYSNWSGDGISSYSVNANSLAKTTIANQPQLILTLYSKEATEAEKEKVD